MEYQNRKHRMAFEEAIRKKDRKNRPLLAALYLLTADYRLWKIMKSWVEKSAIHFDKVQLRDLREDGYALYCAGRDLYAGTKNLTITDLADPGLISPKSFALICHAMAICRDGLIDEKMRGEDKI